MRIVLITDWFLYYTIELANSLVGLGHDVMLITRNHNYEISSPDQPTTFTEFISCTLDSRVKHNILQYRRGDYRNAFDLKHITKLINNYNPDVVHIQHNHDWRICILSLIYARKLIITIHDVISHMGAKWNVQHLTWKIQRGVAKKILVHGKYLKNQMIQNYPSIKAAQIFIIPHGVLNLYKNWDTKNIQEEAHTILFFGRVSKYKGIDILIDAEPFISRVLPNIKIIIAGTGDDFNLYKQRITHPNSFEIHNRFITNSEIPVLFRRASMVVLPYKEASQSGVVPIAYSFGKPVVVTDVGSIPEVVKDGISGFIVPPNDPVALAEAILKILKDDELRRTMGRNAQEMAETELSWDVVSRKTIEVYRENLNCK